MSKSNKNGRGGKNNFGPAKSSVRKHEIRSERISIKQYIKDGEFENLNETRKTPKARWS